MNIKKICALIIMSMLSYIDVYSLVGLFFAYGIKNLFFQNGYNKYDLYLVIPIAIGLLHKLAII